MSQPSVNIGSRIASMFLDYLFVMIVIPVVGMVALGLYTLDAGPDEADPIIMLKGVRWIMVLTIGLWLSKDVFGGRSLAKRILRHQVVKKGTETPAHPLRTLLRNLTTLFWPIGFIWTLVRPQRRLGDLIAGTEIIAYEGQAFSAPTAWYQSVSAGLAALIACWLLFQPLFSDENMGYAEGRGEEAVPEETSIQTDKSAALEEALVFKMGPVFSNIEAEVFDATESGDPGFVRVNLYYDGERPIPRSRLYNFRAMVMEICSQTLPEAAHWPGEMYVRQHTELGDSEKSLYW